MAKILISEDDDLSRKVVVRQIESLGHTGIQSSHGERSWEILVDNPDICLAVLDISMPGMDGRQLLQLIRGNDKFKNLPVIVVSGVIKLNEINSILEMGANRFLPKPVAVDEFKQYMRALLSENKDTLSTI